jgi:hypothetical protein
MATRLPPNDKKTPDYQLSLLAYQSRVDKPLDDGGSIAGEMVAMHDGGSCPDDDDGPEGVS